MAEPTTEPLDAPPRAVQSADPAHAAAPARARINSPLRMSWRSFRRHKPAMIGLVVLGLLYFVAIFADFLAPYGFDDQERDLQWAPPTELRFRDASGFSFRPFINPKRSYIDENFEVRQDVDRSVRLYMRFFVAGDEHLLLGVIPCRTRLFGFDPAPKAASGGDEYFSRFYLLGSDVSGRDIFSRLCYGARISMSIGLVGTSLTLIFGLSIGGVSGYVGGITDNVLQRFGEMIMLLPGFYLLLMLRFIFPANMDSVTLYFLIILILSLIGWPGLARVIRGMVTSIRSEDYIHAARAAGAPPWRIIRRHVLPNTLGYVIVSATLSIPGYILGESALSILGLGIMEPTPSWGNMLQKAMDITELDQHPWVLWPGGMIFLTVMAFNLVGDGLRDALDPRRLKV